MRQDISLWRPDIISLTLSFVTKIEQMTGMYQVTRLIEF